MLFDIQDNILDSKRSCRYHLKQLDPEVDIEAEFVSFANAISDPGAVMVMSCYTLVTLLAVFSSKRLLKMADGAVFILNEKDNIIVAVSSFSFKILCDGILLKSFHLFIFFLIFFIDHRLTDNRIWMDHFCEIDYISI